MRVLDGIAVEPYAVLRRSAFFEELFALARASSTSYDHARRLVALPVLDRVTEISNVISEYTYAMEYT